MRFEKLPLSVLPSEDYSAVAPDEEEKTFPVRDDNNKKLDVTDLFGHFTANIIKQDLPFVR